MNSLYQLALMSYAQLNELSAYVCDAEDAALHAFLSASRIMATWPDPRINPDSQMQHWKAVCQLADDVAAELDRRELSREDA